MRRAVCVAAMALAGCGGASAASGDEAMAIDPHRPIELTLARVDRTALDLASLRGRAVLLIAFRMDDLSSNATLRDADRLAREYPDDLTVVGLSGDEQPPAQLPSLLDVFARVLELRATVLTIADEGLREGASPLGAIEHVPTVWLVNRAGLVAQRAVGLQRYAQLAALVAPALPPGVRPRRDATRPAADPAADPVR